MTISSIHGTKSNCCGVVLVDEVHVAVAAHELSARATLGWLSVWLYSHSYRPESRSHAYAEQTCAVGSTGTSAIVQWLP